MKHVIAGGIVGMVILGMGFGVRGAEAAGLYAGTAKADITPAAEDAVNLSNRKLTVGDERIYARVIVLKTDETSLAIVSLDLILFSSAKVVAEAREKWGVGHVILSSTHTHSSMAPDGLRIGGPGRPSWHRMGADPGELVDWPALSEDPWYADTENKIVAAIGEAVNNLFPATIAGARAPFESAYMAHNRRLVGEDGRVRAMWDNPNRLPTEPIDHTIGAIQVNDEAGKPRAFLVHYACHPVAVPGGHLHRDFPGSLVDYIEEQLGDECMAMFLQGAEGDLDPYDMPQSTGGGDHAFNIIKYAGISLAKGALRLAETLEPPDRQAASIKVKESLLTINYRRGEGSSDVLITTVVINDKFALVAVPGEPFIQHQLDLAAKSPVPHTFMLGLAYSGAGTPFTVYIPTAQAVQEGGYGATQAAYLEAKAGEMIVNEALAAIKALIE